MVGETKGSFVRWLANLNTKRNLTSMFVNKYLPYENETLCFCNRSSINPSCAAYKKNQYLLSSCSRIKQD